jgi:hypothetical protein
MHPEFNSSPLTSSTQSSRTKQATTLSTLRSLQLLRILFRKPLLRRSIRLDLLPRQLLAELTPSANLITILQKEERNYAQYQTDETKQTTSPRNPQTLVHRPSSKRQHHSEQTARTRSRGGRTRGEDFVGVDEVVEEGHKDEQICDSERDGGEDGDYPVY